MKYKEGDKVRVRKDLKVKEKYDGCYYTSHMNIYRGKIVEIAIVCKGCNRYLIKEDDKCFWSEEMFEPLMTNFDKVKEIMTIEDVTGYGNPFCKTVHKMRREPNCDTRFCDECKGWLKQPYEEYKEILDKQEKEYLSAVIKPFRNRVNYIIKMFRGSLEYICIYLGNGVLGSQGDGVFLPYFEKNSMYKGMEAGKEYTLEELGL